MSHNTPPRIGFARSFSVGVPFWTIVEHGTRKRTHELGMTLDVRHCANEPEMAAAIQSLTHQHVDAIIVAAMDPTDTDFIAALEQATAAGIPLVAVDAALTYPVACLIRSDDIGGV